MKRRTRLMAWLMAIIMLITSVPSSAFASAGNTEPVLESQENTEYAMESWSNTEPATERQEESESIDFGESKIPDTDTVDTMAQSRTEEATTEPVHGESMADNESNSGEPAAGTESNGVESDAVSTETDPDQTEQNLRPAMDFSNDEQFLELKLEKLTYWDTDSKENICMPENNRLDLSGLSQDDLSGMEFTYVFRLLIENIDGGLKQNDTFSFVVPEEYFLVESTLQPTPIYNCQLSDHDKATDQQVGLYEIHGNKVTVTLDAHVEDVAVTYVTAALKIKASVHTESLTVNEAEIRLEHSKTNIVLPAAMDESKSSSEAETETTLGRFRALFDGVALSTGRAASNMSGALRTKHIYKDKLPEGFDEIQLTVSSKDGGYINSDENPVVNFAYKVFLDEAVLYRRSEEMAMDSTFPVDSGDTQAWLAAVQEWINSHPEFEPIEYTFNMGEYFKTSSSGIYPITMQQYQMDIGTFGVEEGLLTIRMNPICCFMDNVFFEFDIDAVIDKDKLDEKPLEVIVDDLGELLFQSVGAAQGGGGTTGDTKYIVTKDAPTKVTDTTIEYKITVEAKEGERLNGLTLKDIVPSGLEAAFANVTIKNTAGRGEMVEFNGAEYTFAPYDPDQTESEINSAEFTFVMELNEAQYSNFITNGINQTFTNKAALYGEDPGKPLAESDEVSTRMIAKFIQKTGKAQNLEGTKYGWTINLTTQLPLMEYGYLVDTLCWTDHQYDFDSGIQVQVDGTSYNINNFVNISDKFSGTWNGLTAQSMNAAGITGEFSTEAPTAYYYLIDEADENGKAIANPFSGLAENEPTNKQRAILIIPYKNLQGTTGHPRPVTIKYTTKLNMHGLGEDNNPQKYWDVMQDKGYSPIIDNEVNLLWYNRGGVGPGPAPQESVNFGKEVETSPGAVSKKGIRYNEKTQMLTWSIDVNKFGIDMGNVILEDNLPENIFEVPSNFTVNWYRYSHKDQKLTGSGAYTPAAGESCEIIAGSTAESKTLRIDLGDVQADDLYTLTFSVKLADSSLLSVQSQSLSTANQVKITYLLGENPKEYMVEGTMGVKNTLIEKEAAGSYDYNTYELPWKVTINPNNLAINGAQFTDTLEKGFSLGRITKVEYDGVEDSAKLLQLQNQQAAAGFDKENPQFDLGDIDRTYTIYFTTVAGDQWRNEHLKSGLNNGELKNVSVENKAELHGKVGSHQIKDALDTASNTVPVNPIAKSGIYHEDTGTIDWTLEFNLEHCNMAGLILSELLTEDGKTPIHEMDVDSLEVVKLSDDGSGTYTEKNAIGSGAEIIRLTQEGFQCKFTEVDGAGNYDTYRIRFTTCLTGDAYGQTIKNKVYLQDEDGNVANSSGTSDGGYDGSFQMDRDSNAQVRPSVKLRKISSNSTGEVKADSLALSNARFVLEAHEFTYDSDTKSLNIGNNVIQYSKARYTQDGEIYFTNIKTSNVADGKNNLICVIKEEAAADGYVIDETPRFVYFSTASGNTLSGDVDKIKFNSKEYTDPGALYQHLIISDKGTTTAATVVFENSPIKSEFSFTKQDVDLSNYTDKDGVITNAYTSAVDVKFVVEPLGDLAGHVNNQIIETKMGEATISNLDAGTYQITETKADTGMKPGSVKLEVTWDSSTKGYKYAFVKNSGTGGLDLSPDNDNTLINALNTATVKFKKYVDYTDGTGDSTVSDNQQPLEGAAFRIVSTDPTPGGFGVAAGNIHKTAKSGSNGEVVFSGLPLGNYKIYEVYKSGSENLSVPGYVTDGDQSLVYTLSITETEVEKDGVYEKTLARLLTPHGSPSEAGAQADTAEICYNRPIKGTISFTKTSSGGDDLTAFNGQVLVHAKFGLFRKINGTAGAPIYEAVSDTTGDVKFQDVEYGDYVLKEIDTPVGYETMQPVDITRADLQIDAGNTGFSYHKTNDKGENALTIAATNSLHRESLALVKQDTDDQPMAGVKFSVYRRGRGIVKNDGGIDAIMLTPMTVDVPEGTNTYYQYLPSIINTGAGSPGEVITGNDGKITITNLPYGDYLLVEDTEGMNLQHGSSKVAVHIKVSQDDAGIYKVAVRANENANISYDESTKAYTLDNTTDSGWTDCKATGDGSYIIVNHKKYGFVNLKKVIGIQSGGAAVGNPEQPLAGAIFYIYIKDSSGNSKLYLTLQTNDNGQFTIGADGAYKDASGKAKHLWYGDYTIKEIKSPDGYCLNDVEIPFTIGEGEKDTKTLAGHLGTAWIACDGSDYDVTYVAGNSVSGSTQVPEGKHFVNVPVVLNLYKTDDSEQNPASLGGTKFLVKPQKAEDTFADGSSEKKITTDNSGKACLSGLLIAGHTYILTEIQAKAGYVTPESAKAVFTVAKDGKSVSISGNAGENSLNAVLTGDNTLELKNSPTKVSIKKVDENGQSVAGAQLALYTWDGKFVKGATPVKTWESVSSAREFTGEIAEGTYVLEETKRPSGYFLADPVYFTVKAGNKIELIAGPDGNVNGQLDGNTNTLSMVDKKVLADITINKTFTGEKTPIKGVAFALINNSGSGNGTLVVTQVTDANGQLSFKNIPEGSYTIKENLQASLTAGVADDVYINEALSIKVEITTDVTQKQVAIKVDDKLQGPDILVTNDVFAAGLTMKKLDPVDGEPLAGVRFLLEKKNGDSYEPYVRENNNGLYTTDSHGLNISGLVRGEYRLTETDTIFGYLPDPVFSARFTVTNDVQSETLVIKKDTAADRLWQFEVLSGETLLTEDGLTNLRAAGSVSLKKVAQTQTDDGSMESTGLNGVVYELYMKKDGGWLSNTWDFITGNQYESIEDMTGEALDQKGLLTIDGLEWGEYKLVEKTPLDGYILDTAEYAFTIGRAETDIVLAVDKGSIVNIPNALTIEKRGSDLQPGDGDGDLLDGSVFTITNVNDPSDTRNISVDKGRIVLNGMLTGGETYVLHEITAPEGYARNPSSEDVTFTMGTDGQVSVDGRPVPGNVLTIVNQPSLLTFTKAGRYNEDCSGTPEGSGAPDALRPLAGAEFTAYPADTPDTPAAVAVSDASGTVSFEKLPIGKYIIKETKTPDKYRPNENIYLADGTSGDFHGLMDADGNPLENNCIVNDVYRTDIRFTKVNEKKPEEVLEGSEYGLYRRKASEAVPVADRTALYAPLMHGQEIWTAGSNTAAEAGAWEFMDSVSTDSGARKFMDSAAADSGARKFMDSASDSGEWQLIATAVTDTKGLLEFKGVLMDTEYMVRELKAPDGSYVSANPMKLTFTLDDRGEVHMAAFDGGDGTVEKDPETGEIIWYEPPVEVSISKVDTDGRPLAGALLQIQDNTGKVIDEWTSQTEPHLISGVLITGESYKLVEVKAPDGYLLASPVSFNVSGEAVAADENKTLSVTIVNEKEELPEESEDESSSESESESQTESGSEVPSESESESQSELESESQSESEIESEPHKENGTGGQNNSGGGVKTGDETPVWPLAAVCTVSLGIILVAVRKRKKNI